MHLVEYMVKIHKETTTKLWILNLVHAGLMVPSHVKRKELQLCRGYGLDEGTFVFSASSL